MKQEFKATLVAKGPKGAWTYLSVPFDVQEVFGSKARVPVAGAINGFPFRNSLMPDGDGAHSMMVSKELQVRAKAQAADQETDLKENSQAASLFATHTSSQKSEHV